MHNTSDRLLQWLYTDIRHRIDYHDTITVLVGTAEKPFTVHREALCAKSRFFAAACSSRWTEGKEKVVRLSEQKAESFQEYVHWVYNHEIDLEPLPEQMSASPNTTELDKGRRRVRCQYLELYLLADKLRDTKLANRVMDLLVDVCCVRGLLLPSVVLITRAYEQTAPGSRLRSLLVDLWVACRRSGNLEGSVTGLPRDFVNDLVMKLLPATPRTPKAAIERGKRKYQEIEVDAA